MTCMWGIIVVRLQSLQERQASRHNAAGDHILWKWLSRRSCIVQQECSSIQKKKHWKVWMEDWNGSRGFWTNFSDLMMWGWFVRNKKERCYHLLHLMVHLLFPTKCHESWSYRDTSQFKWRPGYLLSQNIKCKVRHSQEKGCATYILCLYCCWKEYIKTLNT